MKSKESSWAQLSALPLGNEIFLQISAFAQKGSDAVGVLH